MADCGVSAPWISGARLSRRRRCLRCQRPRVSAAMSSAGMIMLIFDFPYNMSQAAGSDAIDDCGGRSRLKLSGVTHGLATARISHGRGCGVCCSTAVLPDLSTRFSGDFLLATPGASGPAVADQCEGCGGMMASLALCGTTFTSLDVLWAQPCGHSDRSGRTAIEPPWGGARGDRPSRRQ